mmetsp:Transcript_14607/g.35268  ORF Transcript_14607/g.35268 Transcript_14607/m.35268 type:complete len:316 (-) Transcript_14607:2534-3481(-)
MAQLTHGLQRKRDLERACHAGAGGGPWGKAPPPGGAQLLGHAAVGLRRADPVGGARHAHVGHVRGVAAPHARRRTAAAARCAPHLAPATPPARRQMRPLDMFYQRVSAVLRSAGVSSTASRRHWPCCILRDTVSGLSSEAPRDLLQRELWCSSPGGAAWLGKVTTHARSVATAFMFGHLLGLGDRRLDNVLVDYMRIDYNIAYNRGLTLGVPELVPFRLTPVMVAALGPTSTQGAFRLAAEATLGALRAGRGVLLGLLEAFVRDSCWSGRRRAGAGASTCGSATPRTSTAAWRCRRGSRSSGAASRGRYARASTL